MAAAKHAGARWLEEMYGYIKENPQLVVDGFVQAGIPQAIDSFYDEKKVKINRIVTKIPVIILTLMKKFSQTV